MDVARLTRLGKLDRRAGKEKGRRTELLSQRERLPVVVLGPPTAGSFAALGQAIR